MAYAYHANKQQYFEHQRRVTAEHVLPFIERSWSLPEPARVMEIGCGEAGVLKAFIDRGCSAVGVDLNQKRLDKGRELLNSEIGAGQLRLVCADIYDSMAQDDLGRFDLIVLKDVIEHIDDQQRLLTRLHEFLRPGGTIFFGFPPWLMPFGGHQQVCRSKFISAAPYIHLLPTRLYERLLTAAGESPAKIDTMLSNKRTGITIERFERIAASTGYRTLDKRTYLLNPIYAYRFGVGTREQLPIIDKIPYVRDLVTTTAYYLLGSH
jgi:SAM-dependent methyltransferase